MDDLVHFVKDLLELEEKKKRANEPNFKKKITSQSLKPKAEAESKVLKFIKTCLSFKHADFVDSGFANQIRQHMKLIFGTK